MEQQSTQTIPLSEHEREILMELQVKFNDTLNLISRIRGLKGKRVMLSQDFSVLEVASDPQG